MKFTEYLDWKLWSLLFVTGIIWFPIMIWMFEGTWDYTWWILTEYVIIALVYIFGVNYLIYYIKFKRKVVVR